MRSRKRKKQEQKNLLQRNLLRKKYQQRRKLSNVKLSKLLESFFVISKKVSILYIIHFLLMTFLEKTKRFLEPLLQDKKYLILSCIKFTLWAFYSILIIILIKNTTNAIITDDIESFESITQIFTFCIILYFIINYIGRKWEWPILYYKTEKYISDTYVRKMMMIDNNYIEAL